jgi:hypothetical protein
LWLLEPHVSSEHGLRSEMDWYGVCIKPLSIVARAACWSGSKRQNKSTRLTRFFHSYLTVWRKTKALTRSQVFVGHEQALDAARHASVFDYVSIDKGETQKTAFD